MLKRVVTKFRPSPAMAVALVGVALGLGSTGWAANGAAFVLGVLTNSATALTKLSANFNGSAMQLSNASAGAAATALTLTTAATRPPMAVNSTVKVAKFNADSVDGLDATTQLARVRRIAFNLPAFGSSQPITLPANAPMQLIGVTVGLGSDPASVGQASLLRFPGSFILWNGVDSTWTGGNAISKQGYSATLGTVMVYIDYHHQVAVAVATADSIRIDNHSAFPRSGSITLIW